MIRKRYFALSITELLHLIESLQQYIEKATEDKKRYEDEMKKFNEVSMI